LNIIIEMCFQFQVQATDGTNNALSPKTCTITVARNSLAGPSFTLDNYETTINEDHPTFTQTVFDLNATDPDTQVNILILHFS